MGIRHCRKIEQGGVPNICGIMEGRTPWTVTLYIYSSISATGITCWYHLEKLSWSFYDTSFHLIKWLESNWKMTISNVHEKPMKLLHKHFAVVHVWWSIIIYSRNKRYYTKLYGKSLSQSVYHATSKSCMIQSNNTVYTVFFGWWYKYHDTCFTV